MVSYYWISSTSLVVESASSILISKYTKSVSTWQLTPLPLDFQYFTEFYISKINTPEWVHRHTDDSWGARVESATLAYTRCISYAVLAWGSYEWAYNCALRLFYLSSLFSRMNFFWAYHSLSNYRISYPWTIPTLDWLKHFSHLPKSSLKLVESVVLPSLIIYRFNILCWNQ